MSAEQYMSSVKVGPKGQIVIPKEVRTVPNFQSLIRIIKQGKGMGLCGYFSKTSPIVISSSSAISTVRGVIISEIATSSSSREFVIKSRSCELNKPSSSPFLANRIISSSLMELDLLLEVILLSVQRVNLDTGSIITLSQ